MLALILVFVIVNGQPLAIEILAVLLDIFQMQWVLDVEIKPFEIIESDNLDLKVYEKFPLSTPKSVKEIWGADRAREGDKKSLGFYWSGNTDKGRACEPGSYRLVVVLDVEGQKPQKFVTTLIIKK